MRKRFLALLAPTLALLASCASPGAPTMEALRASQPWRASSFYVDGTPASVPDRITPAPERLVAMLRAMDGTDAYEAYEPAADEKALFADYYARLPRAFRDVMDERLIAIYFIDGFAGGGMTDFTFGPGGELLLVLIVNPETLRRDLGDWISYRDSSAFEPGSPDPRVAAECSAGTAGEGGRPYKGLLHTLAHEAAHIYDFCRGATPFVEPVFDEGSRASTPFTEGVWEGYASPVRGYDFRNRLKASAYGLGKPLPAGEAAAMVDALWRTPFSSLYGSRSWTEDFAETFAWYWLGEECGVRYEVTVSRGGKPLARYAPADNPLVTARYPALSSLLD